MVSITCTNILDAGIGGVRAATTASTSTSSTASTPSSRPAASAPPRPWGDAGRRRSSWQVNGGWVIAANIAADLAAWTRSADCDDADLRDADPDTLRYRVWHLPARLARHARQRTLAISRDRPWKEAFLALLAAALRPASTA